MFLIGRITLRYYTFEVLIFNGLLFLTLFTPGYFDVEDTRGGGGGGSLPPPPHLFFLGDGSPDRPEILTRHILG